MTHVDRDRVVAALEEDWAALLDLLDGLAPGDWARPTDCPGWSVQDNVSHVVGLEAMLEGRPMPDVELGDTSHIRNDLGRFNELWVESYRSRSPGEVLADLRAVVAARRATLAGMDEAAFEAPAATPVGEDTYGRFMRIRVMDTWFHEQDVREAVGVRGHLEGLAPEFVLEEVRLGLGYVVGKKAGAPEGSTVRFDLTGPLAGRLDYAVTDRARPTERIDGEPTVTLTVPGDRLLRFVGGRATTEDAGNAVKVTGDATLGGAIVTNLPYMI
jgi:uncharacterized protein (TIGR03083 family)